ncbi:hypothetical protein Scep_030661 [Stephania cephalantha]|uniref:Uncharacterized protein n=1 Tax=Stephania cephalantha TaxID=152367 RepID=A0AAP0E011_9MAGN
MEAGNLINQTRFIDSNVVVQDVTGTEGECPNDGRNWAGRTNGASGVGGRLGRVHKLREGNIMGRSNRDEVDTNRRRSLVINNDEPDTEGESGRGKGKVEIGTYNSDPERGCGSNRSSDSGEARLRLGRL